MFVKEWYRFLAELLVLPRLTSKAKKPSYQQIIHNAVVSEEQPPEDLNIGIQMQGKANPISLNSYDNLEAKFLEVYKSLSSLGNIPALMQSAGWPSPLLLLPCLPAGRSIKSYIPFSPIWCPQIYDPIC
jgi:hypothetical protein